MQHSWCAASFAQADVIYLLEPPPLLCRARIVRRFFSRKLRKTVRPNETLGALCHLLRWTKKFYAVNLPQIEAALRPYDKKVVRLSRPGALKRVLSIGGQPSG